MKPHPNRCSLDRVLSRAQNLSTLSNLLTSLSEGLSPSNGITGGHVLALSRVIESEAMAICAEIDGKVANREEGTMVKWPFREFPSAQVSIWTDRVRQKIHEINQAALGKTAETQGHPAGNQATAQALPDVGFVRVPQILRVLPIGKSTLWAWTKTGKFPPPVKLSARTTVWPVAVVREFLQRFAALPEPNQY